MFTFKTKSHRKFTMQKDYVLFFPVAAFVLVVVHSRFYLLPFVPCVYTDRFQTPVIFIILFLLTTACSLFSFCEIGCKWLLSFPFWVIWSGFCLFVCLFSICFSLLLQMEYALVVVEYMWYMFFWTISLHNAWRNWCAFVVCLVSVTANG